MRASTLRLLGGPAAGQITGAVDVFMALALSAGAIMITLEVWYLLASQMPYGPDAYVIGRDFVNTWMGARIALTGDPTPWFDYDTYNAALEQQWRAPYPKHIWSYPPHVLLFTWPFGLIPYLPSFIAWLTLGLTLYLLVGMEGQWNRRTALLLLLSPAVVLNVFVGQNGFFTAALLIGGLTMLDRRPILAGVLFGVLTIKPQLGVLLPLMLLLTARWRTIAAAAVSAAVLIGLTAAVFGPGVWTAYRDVAMPPQAEIFLHGVGVFVAMMPTVFMNVRVIEMPLEVAWAAQAVVSSLAVAGLVWVYWKPRDPLLSLAFLLTATFVATPYAFNYDMVVFGWLFAKLIERQDNTLLDYGLMLAVWTLPATTMVLGLVGVPGSALVLAAFAIRLGWRLRLPPDILPVVPALAAGSARAE